MKSDDLRLTREGWQENIEILPFHIFLVTSQLAEAGFMEA